MWQSEVLRCYSTLAEPKKGELFSIQYFDSLPVNAESLQQPDKSSKGMLKTTSEESGKTLMCKIPKKEN